MTGVSALPRSGLPFHAEVVRTGLSPRYLGGLVEIPGRSKQIILLEQGALTLDRLEVAEHVEGPAILWITDQDAVRVRARAGSTVGHLILGETTLANAIGHKPEAVDLRLLAGRSFRLSLAGDDGFRSDVQRAFDLILREAYGRAPGYETVTEAQIRVLLVLLWRNTARPDALRAAPATSAVILQRFRQMVETHFRDRWTVARYSAELGVSPDRLHGICARVLGTPPLRLIHGRTAQEAEVLLERSTQTLDQIAAYLGFRSTPQFSAFFRAETGHPPGAWRKAVRQDGEPRAAVQKRSYSDWP
ncbi:AraC family transcriptional regulator [Anianabacter salinae]|uniref:AraC family transcriptional regulator n=1 Tax=Anianabacter salinae TaxID=2851023 RepID=UPI00225DE6D3|nr:AraC family transcriptional regulator [Anianabacter salinae]MBV0910915.1 AraC family transcriptional regulator [Anianabacter salinae]